MTRLIDHTLLFLAGASLVASMMLIIDLPGMDIPDLKDILVLQTEE